ncbi:hypothetical protein PRZ48_009147 [Zasmidium cellare]|uniref:Major facilitator superfamily (MFS) profile domain-containing protein n=1 Tax=Zasmidium cellare TaxID=395010 RepID=A0ABR0EAX9_ZASCE|nr:hypothetical protein PRZ48_009147 [Zasmidium cellare]
MSRKSWMEIGLMIAQVRQYKAIAQDVEQNQNTSNTTTTPGCETQEAARSDVEKRSSKSREEEQQREHHKAERLGETWAPNDPHNPQNWSYTRKWIYTIIVCMTNFITSGAASFDTEVVPQAMQTYNLHGTPGEQVALLATTLYMVMFGLGTPIAAPLSETFGRNPVYIFGLLGMVCFSLGSAAAPNVQTWIICRAFMGFFGSPPNVTFGGTSADMWSPKERTYIFPILSSFVFLGPFVAPTVADLIATSPLVDWHWTSWLTAIVAGSLAATIAVFVPETYSPVLLAYRAKCGRRSGGHGKGSVESGKVSSLFTKLRKSMLTPWTLLATEPMLTLFTLYLFIIYSVLFGLLPGFTYIFGANGYYGFSQTGVGLCFLAMDVGFLAALPIVAWVYPRYLRRLKEGGGKVVPEERLWYAIIGGPLLPISIFWLAWTPPSGLSFWCPLVASGVFGLASLTIFISIFQYTVDTYESVCASALVGMTISRYIVGAMMIHAAIPMIQHMGVPKALTVWGALAAVMAPVPLLFYWKGHIFRAMSTRATDMGAWSAANN